MFRFFFFLPLVKKNYLMNPFDDDYGDDDSMEHLPLKIFKAVGFFTAVLR